MTSPALTRAPHTLARSELQARFDIACTDAARAGNWPASASTAWSEFDEIKRQEAILNCASALTAAYLDAMTALAERSRFHASHVTADQDGWSDEWRITISDLFGDTFGCLPKAIERAKREAGGR
jgi:hypothetical protein